MSKIYTDLRIDGQLIYNNNPQNGYVLTTDENGLVSWTSSTSILATASDSNIGGVSVGTGLTISSSGVLSLSNSSSGVGVTYSAGTGLTLSGTTFSLSIIYNKLIYVSVTGSNSNNGLSEFTPVLNLWKARDLAVSGDTVIVMPGEYIFDNRNSAGCPYNGLVESKVNLWKDGVTYHFMPGAKIYSYGSTSISYSPYSDNMIYFQPNSLTYSECFVTGDLEFYAISEGADNSGGGSFLFIGEENAGTYPGFRFGLKASLLNGVTGCTALRSVRSAATASACYIDIDVDKIKYSYTTGQSSNASFITWRGGDGNEMLVNMKIGELIGGGTSYLPIFFVRSYSTTTGFNKMRVNIDIGLASMLGYSYMLNYGAINTTSLNSSGQINFNCNSCVFSSSLFWLSQSYKNYYITITGNYYCSGYFTGKYSFFPSTYPFICLWDQTNDAVSDNIVLDFKGNYYTNHPTRAMVYVGGAVGGGLPYGNTNNIGNITGDIYFSGTASNYTGTLFFVDMGTLRYSGRIHGTTNYSGYGFNGSVISFGNHSVPSIRLVTLSNVHIHSNLNSSLVTFGSPVAGESTTLNISNSYIDMTGTSSVIADLRNVNTYIYNSTIRNNGTNELLFNSLSTGSLQLTNSTLLNSSSTASTIYYPLGTVTGAGAFSNKDIYISTLNGTVSVVSTLV